MFNCRADELTLLIACDTHYGSDILHARSYLCECANIYYWLSWWNGNARHYRAKCVTPTSKINVKDMSLENNLTEFAIC